MEIVYNMLAHKSKVTHVEYYILSFYPIRQNNNAYPMEYNNGVDYSSAFLVDDGHLHVTVIPENTDIISNHTPESIDSVLPYLHISGKNIRSDQAKQILPQILPFSK